MPDLDLDRIRSLPKISLHDHLDGGVRPGTVLELDPEHPVEVDIAGRSVLWQLATGRFERVDVDAELLGVIGVERVLRIDEGADPSIALGVGDGVQRDGGLAAASRSDQQRAGPAIQTAA